jgi:tetratricopeptide (TPR) repeat protein
MIKPPFKMIRHIFILFFTFATCQLFAQQLNTPKEFADIMKYSQIRYFADSNVTIKRDLIVLEIPPFSATVSGISDSRKIAKLIKKGNKSFEKRKYEKASKYYEKALVFDKNNFWVLNKIGTIYNYQNQPQKGIDIFSNLLIINDLDFNNWSELAIAYTSISDTSAALEAITKAHVLNRNDTIIKNKMIEMYKYFGYDFNKKGDFIFNYELKEIGKDSVKIHTKTALWNSYANCKAVWKYDKNYQKARANDFPKNLDFVQEKECLLNFLMFYETASEVDKKALKSEYDLLTKAIDTKHLNAFIQYEIWAVEKPVSMHEIPLEDFEKVMKYVKTIRSTAKLQLGE